MAVPKASDFVGHTPRGDTVAVSLSVPLGGPAFHHLFAARLADFSETNPHRVIPVFSSGQTVLQAAPTYAALGSTDLIFCAGGGVVAHPSGVAAGVGSLREAWEAAVAGVPLGEAVAQSRQLAEAVETFS